MKSKKVFFLLLISILLIPCFVKAEEDESNNIKLDSITLNSKSENAEEVSSAKLDGKKISLDLKLYDPGDYVEYSIKIKNVSEKEYTFDKSTFKVEKEYLTYEFSYDEESNTLKPDEERILKLRVLYTNKVPETLLVNDSFNAENSLIISLTNDDKIVPIINPETGLINPIFYVSIMILSGVMLLIIFKGSKKTKVIVVTLFALTIIPLYTYALTKIDIDIDAKILIDGKEAYFLIGREVNAKMKKLADDSNTNGSTDNNIISILESKVEPGLNNKEEKNIVSLPDSPYPIYMWYEDGILYWWSEDKSPNVNSDARSMFTTMKSLTDISGLEDFDVSRVTTMYSMFHSDSSLKSLNSLHKWNTSNVTDMTATFALDISLESLEGLESWDVSKVTTMMQTFAGHSTIGPVPIKSLKPLKNWDVSNVENFSGTFQRVYGLTSLEGLENWNVSSANDMSYMFSNCINLENIESLRNWNVSKVTNIKFMFARSSFTDLSPLKKWNVSSVTLLNGFLERNANIISLNGLEEWNTSKVTKLDQFCDYCASLSDISALSSWDTSSVESMTFMFAEDTSLQDVSAIKNWDNKNLNDMTAILYNCPVVKLDLSGFKTPRLTNINNAFRLMSSLEEIDISGIDLSNVTKTSNLFLETSNLQRIKTPKSYPTNVSKKITLPATFCDEDGNHYTKLDNTSPTQTWLTKCE